jgi:hypothetical protein
LLPWIIFRLSRGMKFIQIKWLILIFLSLSRSISFCSSCSSVYLIFCIFFFLLQHRKQSEILHFYRQFSASGQFLSCFLTHSFFLCFLLFASTNKIKYTYFSFFFEKFQNIWYGSRNFPTNSIIIERVDIWTHKDREWEIFRLFKNY